MDRVLRSATLLALLPFIGCASGVSKGIVYSESADLSVQNGTAYDTASLAMGDHHTVVIPNRAQLKTSPTSEPTIRIEMEKTLGYMGHPPERHSIDQVRDDLGCAWRSEGGKLHLATFGEFLTSGDGGKTIELTVTAPDGVRIERNDAYEMSRDEQPNGSKLKRHRDHEGLWYSPRDFHEKWTPIHDEPNPTLAVEP